MIMTSRRVLFVTSSFPRWAGDSSGPFILNLAQDLRALGWDVDVLAPHAPSAATRENFAGIAVRRFRYAFPVTAETVCYGAGALHNLVHNPWNAAKLPGLVMAEWLAVMRRLATGQYRLVHSHWILPQGIVAGMAARILGVPHVATVHGSDLFALQGTLHARLKRQAIRWADAVTVNSSATEAAALTLVPGARHIHRIPIGASDEAAAASRVAELRARFRSGTGPLLAFVGRIVEQKGVMDLIRAVALLARSQPGAGAVIVGDGPARLPAERLVRELGIADQIAFVGQVAPEEIPAYLAAADVFVGPSRRTADGALEGQGLSVVEAMLAGCPVVATRNGGIVDAIRHEETGLLVAEGAPAEIAASVARIVTDPMLSARLRQNAGILARRNFTRQVSARAFSALFDSVATRRRGTCGGTQPADRPA
ncbi:MAG: glycosyltransferase family 4 protein [Dongiaceae bacterium]